MPKAKVAPEKKRLVISARVTREEKKTLLSVGEGNISRGLDRIMVLYEKSSSRPAPASTTRPSPCT